jgi:hypothetical protein
MPNVGDIILRITHWLGVRFDAELLWGVVTKGSYVNLVAGPPFTIRSSQYVLPTPHWSIEHSDFPDSEYEAFTEENVPDEYWAAKAKLALLGNGKEVNDG